MEAIEIPATKPVEDDAILLPTKKTDILVTKPVEEQRPNRAWRRAWIKQVLARTKKQLRHDKKHSPVVLQRELVKRQRLCPDCHLDFLGAVSRCQCKVR